MYVTFVLTTSFSLALAMSKPSTTTTPQKPNGNLLSISNHVRFWGSLIIATGGLVIGYFYYLSTPEYVPN